MTRLILDKLRALRSVRRLWSSRRPAGCRTSLV